MLAGVGSSLQVTPSGLDLAVENLSRKWMPSNLPADVVDNYREAVINYSKVFAVICCLYLVSVHVSVLVALL